MAESTTWTGEVVRDLGDGLVLRQATTADSEALAAFNADIHRDPGVTALDYPVAAWTRDLLAGRVPGVGAKDFTIVEDTRSGQIASSLCLIDQTWTYAGIPFGVGRPELVGTHPDYRNRGLVRAQFEVIHEWSAQRGQRVQAITGIPYYYRLFGYEMAVNLGGGRWGHAALAPKLGETEEEAYGVRPAGDGDVPFIMEMYGRYCRRWLLACTRDATAWRYEIAGRGERNANRREVRIITTQDGAAGGLLLHGTKLWSGRLAATLVELQPGLSWHAVAPSLIRYLLATATIYAARDGEEHQGYAFALGGEHALYDTIPRWLPGLWRTYAWYLRVPDLGGFLRLITPVLDERLAASPLAGHNGTLTMSFYRCGLKLIFETGRLIGIEPWQPQPKEWGDVRFPGLTFLQVLFGYRTLDELRYAFPDCGVHDDRSAALINALFPKQASDVWPWD